MKRTTIKKLIAALLAVCLLSTALPAAFAVSADTAVYAVLGDSISYGTSLGNSSDRFSSLIAADKGLDEANLAIPGLDSAQLLAILQAVAAKDQAAFDAALDGVTTELTMADFDALVEAEYISLNIGSNDFLPVFLGLVAEGFQTTYTDLESLEAAISETLQPDENGSYNEHQLGLMNMVQDTISLFVYSEEMTALATQLAVNWDGIITTIRTINPDAQLIATNLYNPYANALLFGLSYSFDAGVEAINTVLQEHADKSGDYLLADVYKPMNEAGNVLAAIEGATATFNFDPHPSVAGHQAIAEAVSALFDAEATPAVMTGDVTGDGKINASDATRVLLSSVGKVTLDETAAAAADVNGDGKANASDATLILLHSVGKKLIAG